MSQPCRSSRSASRSHRVIPALALLLFVASLAAVAQEIRLGTEFQVNSYTANFQGVPSVAADADGDFVVAWQSSGQDGSAGAVFARRFSSAGIAMASELQVNTYTTDDQRAPSVAADTEADFIVAWQSSGQDGSGDGVFARRFSSSGAALASEFRVNSYTVGAQGFPSVTADAEGDFVVAWQSADQDGSGAGIFARLFSSAGVSLTSTLVNAYTTGSQSDPSVAAEANGDFVVAWESDGQDGSTSGIFARRFSSTGTGLATEFRVNVFTENSQGSPAVATDADGDFVIAWESEGQDGSGRGIFARRFSSAGATVASEFQVNTNTAGDQNKPSVAADAGGGFVVAWKSDLQDGSFDGVFARRFSSAGAPLASEFQINAYTTNDQDYPAVAVRADGDFVVAWQSEQDGSSYGTFAQRFARPAILDIDGNGDVAPLSDGLLALRYLFGFTGAPLTTGAIGAGCTRCDAAAIELYLQALI